MLLSNELAIWDFMKCHAASRPALATWIAVVKAAHWRDHNDLKSTFNSADYVPGVGYVFNVGGNNQRIVAAVSFKTGIVVIDNVMTHAEYTRWNDRR